MKKISEMTLLQLNQFVNTHASCTGHPEEYIQPPNEKTTHRNLREIKAAERCGSCSVKGACVKLTARTATAASTRIVTGGLVLKGPYTAFEPGSSKELDPEVLIYHRRNTIPHEIPTEEAI